MHVANRQASLAQLAEHALRKRMVMGSILIGGLFRLCCVYVHDLAHGLRIAHVRLRGIAICKSSGLLA